MAALPPRRLEPALGDVFSPNRVCAHGEARSARSARRAGARSRAPAAGRRRRSRAAARSGLRLSVAPGSAHLSRASAARVCAGARMGAGGAALCARDHICRAQLAVADACDHGRDRGRGVAVRCSGHAPRRGPGTWLGTRSRRSGQARRRRRGSGVRDRAVVRGRPRRRRFFPPRPRAQARGLRLALASKRRRVQGRQPASRLRLPALARIPGADRAPRRRRPDRGRAQRPDGLGSALLRTFLRGRSGALPLSVGRRRRRDRADLADGDRRRTRRLVYVARAPGHGGAAAARPGAARALLHPRPAAVARAAPLDRGGGGRAGARPPDLCALRRCPAGRFRNREGAARPR